MSDSNPCEEVVCTPHIIENGRCRFCARTPERIESDIEGAPRRSALMPISDDCGLPGCYGFSCPFCGRCTAECPNMKCCREEVEKAEWLT